MKTSNLSPLTLAVDAARKLHKDHNDFDRTAAAVRRSGYNLLDAIDRLPATVDCQAVVSELDADDLALLQTAGMDGGAAINRLAQAAQREIDKLKKDIQFNPAVFADREWEPGEPDPSPEFHLRKRDA